MRVVIATVQVPFIRGGAENQVEALRDAVATRGHAVEIVAVPHQEATVQDVLSSILACRLLDVTETLAGPVDRFIAMKFPAYLIRHPNKVIWLTHQMRSAYDLWDDQFSRLPDGRQRLSVIVEADERAFLESRAVFTISQNVSRRLRRFNALSSSHLYPPPRHEERFYCASAEGYYFFPSRLSLFKRHHLVLRALASCQHHVRVRMAGAADVPAYGDETMRLAEELGVADRVEWLGVISDAELYRQYAHARAVLFPPLDEDYGYVTLEAMLSSKAVITCTDSGGALELVVPGETAVVVPPTPDALAAAMDNLWGAPARAREMGAAARAHYEDLDLSWTSVVDRLLA